MKHSTTFTGGTGSTPSVSADATRIYVSDADNNVICIDADTLETLWKVSLPENVAANIAVAPEGDI